MYIYNQVAEDTWKTEYELKKKERTSMLANMTVQQHAFSIKQKPVLSTQPQFLASSPPSVATSTKKFLKYDTNMISTPQKETDGTTKGNHSEIQKDTEEKHDDGVCSTYNRDEEDIATSSEENAIEPSAKKRKWFPFFGN